MTNYIVIHVRVYTVLWLAVHKYKKYILTQDVSEVEERTMKITNKMHYID